jgi:shikimate 5-dehydrogenase
MKHYSISNIHIVYDSITNEQYVSKSKLKKVVYNFIYGQISTSMLDDMEKHNIKVVGGNRLFIFQHFVIILMSYMN